MSGGDVWGGVCGGGAGVSVGLDIGRVVVSCGVGGVVWNFTPHPTAQLQPLRKGPSGPSVSVQVCFNLA